MSCLQTDRLFQLGDQIDSSGFLFLNSIIHILKCQNQLFECLVIKVLSHTRIPYDMNEAPPEGSRRFLWDSDAPMIISEALFTYNGCEKWSNEWTNDKDGYLVVRLADG